MLSFLFRQKKRAFDFLKYVFAFIASDVGVMFLAIATAFLGAEMYILIERPGHIFYTRGCANTNLK